MNRQKSKILFFIFLIIASFPFHAKSQVFDDNQYTSMSRRDTLFSCAGVLSNAHYSSTSLSAAFIKPFYLGGYISDELKSYNRHNLQNYMGAAQYTGAYYVSKPCNFLGYNNLGFRISVADHLYANALYGEDLYTLLFKGNSVLAGETADFSGSDINFMHYQEIQFGIFKQSETETERMVYYAGLSFLKGQEYHSAYIASGKLYTEPDGRYLDIALKGIYYFSDTSRIELKDFNGTGGAVNLYMSYENKPNDFIIDASINNLGYIRWNDKTRKIVVDTSLIFEGLEASGLFEFDTSGVNGMLSDSLLQTMIQKNDSGSYARVIPECIYINIRKNLMQNKVSVAAGLQSRSNANTRMPLFYADAAYNFKYNFSAGIILSYGGHGWFNYGIHANTLLVDKIRIWVSTVNLNAFIQPKSSFGASAMAGIQVDF